MTAIRKLQRVVFAGPLGSGSTSGARLRGLRDIGLDIIPLDTTSWSRAPLRLMNSVSQRTFLTPRVWKMNEALVTTAKSIRPDAIWIDKGDWVYPRTLRRLKEHARCLVHYTTDDVLASGTNSWLHRRGMQAYDAYLTTNRFNVVELRQRLRGRVLRAGMGSSAKLCPPPAAIDSGDQFDVIFVGHWEPHTESAVTALFEAGIRVGVWGYSWHKAKNAMWRSVRMLPQDSYVQTIASAKIALCFLSRLNGNESTGRSFEIPAIGTFMLAERTTEHEFLFRDGVDASLFSTERELVDRTRYYLAHAAEREAIAANGHALYLVKEWSWEAHMRREWPIVERLLADQNMAIIPADDAPYWQGFRIGEPWRGATAAASGTCHLEA